ncbi:hypothetical protein KBD87_04605 [Candidatus Saccharibacteria bacterium]|nr:hypothetical protein [Candidatus Saccharibacteria bacterium]
MKDIDFDELDKAVNSLMGTAAADTDDVKPEVAGEESSASNPMPNSNSESLPVVTDPAPEATPTDATSVTPKQAAPTGRRVGRYMDMMPRSSDQPKPAATVSREATTVTPPVDVESPEQSMPSETAEPAAVEEVPSVDESNDLPVADAMPDPIDLAESSSVEPETSNEATAQDSMEEAPEETQETAAVEDTTSAESESPFLPDAKVEKRPLGGDAVVDMAVDANNAQTETQVEQSNVDESPVVPTPPELNPDIMAVESTDPKKTIAQMNESASTVSVEPSAGGSIPQQYKEQPSSGDTTHAAIYDEQTYPANPKPVKKKSGWLWVLWIFILLSLGAGGAVVLYMMHII